jgi:hypothetical protein
MAIQFFPQLTRWEPIAVFEFGDIYFVQDEYHRVQQEITRQAANAP